MANESGVLGFVEVAGGQLTPIGEEILGVARRLADEAGQPSIAALVGSGVEGAAQACIERGADKVLVLDDAALADYLSDTFAPVVEQAVREANPSIIVLGQTTSGRDIAPRLAFRLGTAAVMDAIEIAAPGGRLTATRPCYGGNARATYTFSSSPQIATVRAKAYEPAEAQPSRTGEVVKLSPNLPAAPLSTMMGREAAKVEGVRLEAARVVVSGGRGLGGPEGFRVVEELAGLWGAAVGASRAACDLGWYPVAHQVGLTGKVVSPDLYVAIAISGASQHMAGCGGSKNIVAVNKDAEANIFKAARFGIVGDYKQVVPALIEEVRKAM